MYKKAQDVLTRLPVEYQADLLPAIRKEFLQSEKTVVVFDDDPTGTQTCHDVIVLTAWTVPLLLAELKKKPSILFILTNSRSLSTEKAVDRTLEIGRNLNEAVEQSGRQVIVISRSDSTLRGHFPDEVDAIAKALKTQHAVWLLIPAFIEGARYTIDDVHYILEHGELVPVADTPFAKDSVFGYIHSNLKEWIQEKSNGKIGLGDIMSISIEDIRRGGPELVAKKLLDCKPGKIVIVNAAAYKDLEVLAMAILIAERSGQQFLYRSSATFVSIRAGIAPGKIFLPTKEDISSKHGSLLIVGSYVPKTTGQLNFLLGQKKHETIQIDVDELLTKGNSTQHLRRMIEQTDQWLSNGRDVVIYTSRELKVGTDTESSLKIHSVVSTFVVAIVEGIKIRPSFIIAKGGITSSDVASKGLSSKSALILGQAIAGVPVWKLDLESKFPEMIYIVFPGNVGDEAALWNVWNKFKSPA
ncbi:four-carbon acid sugar kinase family protein [Chryseolinea sp. H1M3-3]|uniref:four-carbon acid sugar kinase family protein n=1 Tax=Chryseolinea sp. H1M3-3 TaxID=3034144 RepID=UPI0023ED3612|nr:four-carbon acid sugar kinase family protein [Chryseolinea sp. H1M3-3]